MNEIIGLLEKIFTYIPHGLVALVMVAAGMLLYAVTCGVKKFHGCFDGGRLKAFRRELVDNDNPAFGVLAAGRRLRIGDIDGDPFAAGLQCQC